MIAGGFSESTPSDYGKVPREASPVRNPGQSALLNRSRPTGKLGLPALPIVLQRVFFA